VVRIGASLPAPLLSVVVSPNEWGKTVKAATTSATVFERAALYEQFWMRYLNRIHELKLGWTKSSAANRQSWLSLSAGTSNIRFGTAFGRGAVYSEIFFGHPDAAVNTQWFQAAQRRQGLETAVGGSLQWQPLPGKKGARIAVYKNGASRTRNRGQS